MIETFPSMIHKIYYVILFRIKQTVRRQIKYTTMMPFNASYSQWLFEVRAAKLILAWICIVCVSHSAELLLI